MSRVVLCELVVGKRDGITGVCGGFDVVFV